MVSIKSKHEHVSTSVPGVTFTVRTLNRIRRSRRDLPILATRQRLSEILREYKPLRKLLTEAPAEFTDDQRRQIDALDAEFTWLRDSEIKPADIRAGLVSIDGLEIDGAPATVETLLNATGPEYDALLEEIHEACEAASGLSPAETKNSQSDTTSTGAVGTDPTVSSAAPAGN